MSSPALNDIILKIAVFVLLLTTSADLSKWIDISQSFLFGKI